MLLSDPLCPVHLSSALKWICVFLLFRPVWPAVQRKSEGSSGDPGRWDPLPFPGVGRLRPPALWPAAGAGRPTQGGVHSALRLLRRHSHPAWWGLSGVRSESNVKRTLPAMNAWLWCLCRCGGAGCGPTALRRLTAPLSDRTGEQRGGGALALRQWITGSFPLLLPAACCHGNLHQPRPGEVGAAAHHRICFRQVCCALTVTCHQRFWSEGVDDSDVCSVIKYQLTHNKCSFFFSIIFF